jgi:hypothetical protein
MLVHHCSSCGARTYSFEDRSPCIITDQRAGQLPEVPQDERASHYQEYLSLTLPVFRAFTRVKFGGWFMGLILADDLLVFRCLMCHENALVLISIVGMYTKRVHHAAASSRPLLLHSCSTIACR